MNKIKLQKGITLIALIITIIILLILAVVTIGSIKESKIIGYAQEATSEHIVEKEKEQIALGYSEYRIASINDPNAKLTVDGATVKENNTNGWIVEFESGNSYPIEPNGNIATYEPVVNPNPTDWTIAYAYNGTEWTKYTEDDQAIGGNAEGGLVEGQIVAKFYKQNTPIEEGSINYNGQIITVPAKDYSYKLYIEGSSSGQMPAMYDGNTTAFGYQEKFITAVMTQNAENFLMAYVTDVIICEGVKNIGEYALAAAINLDNIEIARTVEAIDTYAFVLSKIPHITIPNTVTSIGDHAFEGTILNNLEIPEGVESIGKLAFYRTELKSLIIPSSVRKIGEYAFLDCSMLKEVSIYTEECEFVGFYHFERMYSSRGEYEEKGKIYLKNMSFATIIGNGSNYEFVQF